MGLQMRLVIILRSIFIPWFKIKSFYEQNFDCLAEFLGCIFRVSLIKNFQ